MKTIIITFAALALLLACSTNRCANQCTTGKDTVYYKSLMVDNPDLARYGSQGGSCHPCYFVDSVGKYQVRDTIR